MGYFLKRMDIGRSLYSQVELETPGRDPRNSVASGIEPSLKLTPSAPNKAVIINTAFCPKPTLSLVTAELSLG